MTPLPKENKKQFPLYCLDKNFFILLGESDESDWQRESDLNYSRIDVYDKQQDNTLLLLSSEKKQALFEKSDQKTQVENNQIAAHANAYAASSFINPMLLYIHVHFNLIANVKSNNYIIIENNHWHVNYSTNISILSNTDRDQSIFANGDITWQYQLSIKDNQYQIQSIEYQGDERFINIFELIYVFEPFLKKSSEIFDNGLDLSDQESLIKFLQAWSEAKIFLQMVAPEAEILSDATLLLALVRYQQGNWNMLPGQLLERVNALELKLIEAGVISQPNNIVKSHSTDIYNQFNNSILMRSYLFQQLGALHKQLLSHNNTLPEIAEVIAQAIQNLSLLEGQDHCDVNDLTKFVDHYNQMYAEAVEGVLNQNLGLNRLTNRFKGESRLDQSKPLLILTDPVIDLGVSGNLLMSENELTSDIGSQSSTTTPTKSTTSAHNSVGHSSAESFSARNQDATPLKPAKPPKPDSNSYTKIEGQLRAVKSGAGNENKSNIQSNENSSNGALNSNHQSTKTNGKPPNP